MPDPPIEQYRAAYPRPAANFEGDDILPDDHKMRFVAHLAAYSAGDYEEHLNVFFYDPTNKKLGPSITLQPGEVVGAARAMSSLASRFSTANGFDHDPLDAEGFVRDLAFLDAGDLRTALRTLFSSSATITPHLMWSYRNPAHYDDPFFDVDVSDLSCRLALPSDGVSEHVSFGHALPHAAYRPTCFDAGLFSEWRPGGNTHPLPACAAKYATGLPEIVHDPNVFHNVVTNLQIA